MPGQAEGKGMSRPSISECRNQRQQHHRLEFAKIVRRRSQQSQVMLSGIAAGASLALVPKGRS